MFKMSNNYRAYKDAGVTPIVYYFLTSTRNTRVYGKIAPEDSEIGLSQLGQCDGSITAGDGTFLGALPIVEYSARVLSFGNFRETLIPYKSDFLTSLVATEVGSFLITLDNSDAHFSELLSEDKDEQFLGAFGEIWQGFRGLVFADFLRIIRGQITDFVFSDLTFQLVHEAV